VRSVIECLGDWRARDPGKGHASSRSVGRASLDSRRTVRAVEPGFAIEKMYRRAIRLAEARSAARCSRSISRLSTRSRGASSDSVQLVSGRCTHITTSIPTISPATVNDNSNQAPGGFIG